MCYKTLSTITLLASIAIGPLGYQILAGDAPEPPDAAPQEEIESSTDSGRGNAEAAPAEPETQCEQRPSRQITPDPVEFQRRMHAHHLRLMSTPPFHPMPSLSDLADAGSLQVRDVPVYAGPGGRMLLRQKTWTIAGFPHHENLLIPEAPQSQATDTADRSAEHQPRQPEAKPLPAPKYDYLPVHPSPDFGAIGGSGIGVSVTGGPDGTTVVEERYAGDAAKRAGVTHRSFATRDDSGQPGAGVSVTYDAVNGTRVQRWGSAAAQK